MRYPAAIWYPSSIQHPLRLSTRGVVIHWTAGRVAGDLATLNGPDVDVQFYVTKTGKVYQFVDSSSVAWHAFHTANYNTIGIEHEGSGEPWTKAQFAASVKLAKWIVAKYKIPPYHVDPPVNWRGFYGHKDLSGIDGNNHTDTVPKGTGWHPYMEAVRKKV